MTFHLRHGPASSPTFYTPYNGHECWTDDANLAFRFEDRADAEHVREALMLVDASLEVAIVADCQKAEQQREVQRLHRSSLERTAKEIGAL